jgi:hypothetical protein
MKYIKNFKIFESFNDEDIKISELEPYLIDFKHLGCAFTTSFSWTREIKFPENKKYISSTELGKYYVRNQFRTLNIELRPEDDDMETQQQMTIQDVRFQVSNYLGKMNMSLEEFLDGFNLISDYLNNEHGLELNYIYISNASRITDLFPIWSNLYFPSVENIKSDYKRIIANRIILTFK